MLMLDRDGSLVHSDNRKPKATSMKRAYAELTHKPEEDQTGRIGRLLALAFDQLGLRRLELRVTDDNELRA
ncbi:MAG: hypothetical protein H0T53_17990 [Herpetosiphonaceae bacterium]|nr:hypothetical protein [Herpetosiphonaceae bacterium]